MLLQEYVDYSFLSKVCVMSGDHSVEMRDGWCVVDLEISYDNGYGVECGLLVFREEDFVGHSLVLYPFCYRECDGFFVHIGQPLEERIFPELRLGTFYEKVMKGRCACRDELSVFLYESINSSGEWVGKPAGSIADVYRDMDGEPIRLDVLLGLNGKGKSRYEIEGELDKYYNTIRGFMSGRRLRRINGDYGYAERVKHIIYMRKWKEFVRTARVRLENVGRDDRFYEKNIEAEQLEMQMAMEFSQ